MDKRITITPDKTIDEDLYRTVCKRRINQLIEDLLHLRALDVNLDDDYRAIAKYKQREDEAKKWINNLTQDIEGAR